MTLSKTLRIVVPAAATALVLGALAAAPAGAAAHGRSSAATTATTVKDGRIYFVDGSTGQLTTTTATGAGRRTFPGNVAHPAVSPDGTRVAVEFPVDRGIGIENADGTGLRTLVPDSGSSPSWSPDGSKIVFSQAGDIAVVTVATGAVTYLTHDGMTHEEVSPAWSPNGSYIAYTLRGCDPQGGGRCLVRINAANGSGGRVLTPYDGADITTSDNADWAPYGSQLVYDAGTGTYCSGGGVVIFRISVNGVGKTALTCQGIHVNNDNTPSYSPTGGRIAFTSDERVDTSYQQLYVMNANGSNIQYVDTGSKFGIADPDWAPLPASQTTTTTLTASPTSLPSGHVETLSGSMTPASGQGYGGQRVVISRELPGATTFTPFRTVLTNADGSFSARFADTQTASYQASYAANPLLGFAASSSSPVTVTVS